MKRFSIFALAAVAMFVGCTKDFDTDVKVDDGIVRGELVEMSLVIEDTRVERDDVTGKLSWSEGDQVAVVLSNGGTYTLDTEKYTVNHETGKVTIPSNAAYVIYPASIAKSVNNSTLNLELLQTNKIDKPEDIFNYTPMKGIVEGNVVTFKNLVGFLKVPVTGEGTLSKLIVKSEIFNGFKALARTATLDLSDSNSALKMATNNEGRAWIIAQFNTPIALSTSPAVYLPVPAGTYANLALVAVTDKGATTIYANNSHTVTRSKIKPVASNAINVSAHTPSDPTLLSGTSGDSKMDYANTYIVPPTAGEYAFEAVLADGTELKGGVTAEIVWAEEAGMFNDFHYNPTDNVISFKTNGKEGNALIALTKNTFDGKTVVWTWLLWCTDKPDVTTIIGTNSSSGVVTYKVMDRVLGATWAPNTVLTDQRTEKGWTENYMMNGTVSSKDATDGCGLYYQYQNMIPYPRIKDIDATTNETSANYSNTRIAVQYGFHQYCQYWTSSGACSTISTDDNDQYRTAASYNLSYMYNVVSNKAWCFTPLKGHNGSTANYKQTDGDAYRLWGNSPSEKSPKEIKTNHDPCPAGYMIDNFSGLTWYFGAASADRKGYVRNPENSDVHSATTGYKLYGMWLSGCTNSNGQAVDLYYPCCSNRSQTICKTIGAYSNMGYLYVYNTNNVNSTTYTYSNKDYTMFYGAANQFGASAKNAANVAGTAIGDPWGGNAKKAVNAQAYNVRCRKFGN